VPTQQIKPLKGWPMTFSTSDKDAAVTVSVLQDATSQSAWLLRYVRSFPGTLDQVREVRAFLREALDGCPRADDAVAIGSELAANAVVHSRSGVPGGHFTVRAEVSEGAHVLITVEDEGGPWQARACEPRLGHGLDLVQAIAGQGHWGVTADAGGRQVWARLIWPGAERLDRELSPPAPDIDDGHAELEKLSAELTHIGLTAHLVVRADRLPYLAVTNGRTSAPPQRIYAQADWFFWPTAERFAACDDLTAAAGAVACALQADGEASRA
jgi:serine/threonine-protein kinase RsbW